MVDIYSEHIRKFTQNVEQVIEGAQPKFVRVATLEGLIPLAHKVCRYLVDDLQLEGIELSAYDLSELEALFVRQDYDIALTSRAPGKKKYNHIQELGYQKMQKVRGKSGLHVLSTYEHALQSTRSKGKKKNQRVFVSNSLSIRQHWVEEYGGTGALPTPLISGASPSMSDSSPPVLLLAQDEISPVLWKSLLGIDFKKLAKE